MTLRYCIGCFDQRESEGESIMKVSRTSRSPLAASLLALGALATLAGCLDEAPPADEAELATAEQAAGTFPSVSDFAATGPFSTTSGSLGLSCTVYRPTNLGQGGVTHPVILWGNGTGASVSTYAGLLRHLASHGFIVAAAETSNAGNGSEMISCLNSIISANGSASSPFFQRVDTARVGASGHSQGGAGTIMAGRDARVTATAPIQPYIGFIPFGGLFSDASIRQQRGPMLLISGTADTIAIPGIHQQPVYSGVNQPVVWATRSGATHFEPVGDAGAFRGPVTAWFRARFMNDASAERLFSNPCTLCSAIGWSVLRR
jgi:predicted dienelactone hydrolase